MDGLVGRDSELRQLYQMVDTAQHTGASLVLLGEPGGQASRQRVDLAPHLLQVRAAGGGEVEPVGAGPDGDARDVLGTLLLRDPAAAGFREALVEVYAPRYGDEWIGWAEQHPYARIDARRMYTFVYEEA